MSCRLQKTEWFRGSVVTAKPSDHAWHCIPGALCTGLRPLDLLESLLSLVTLFIQPFEACVNLVALWVSWTLWMAWALSTPSWNISVIKRWLHNVVMSSTMWSGEVSAGLLVDSWPERKRFQHFMFNMILVTYLSHKPFVLCWGSFFLSLTYWELPHLCWKLLSLLRWQ